MSSHRSYFPAARGMHHHASSYTGEKHWVTLVENDPTEDGPKVVRGLPATELRRTCLSDKYPPSHASDIPHP